MSLKNQYIQQIWQLLKKLLVLLILFEISRLFFFLFNQTYFNGNSVFSLLKVFFYGIRFDLAAIVYFNLPFLVLYLLPFPFTQIKAYRTTVFILFWVVNFLLLTLNFADIEYFKYTAKRTTADFFKYAAMSEDFIALLPNYIKDFWHIAALLVSTVAFGIWSTLPKKEIKIPNYKFKWANIFIMLGIIGTMIISARGLKYKPLRIISAGNYTSTQNIPLILNTPFTILHTFQENEEKTKKYFSEEEKEKYFSPIRQYKAIQNNKDNVVIIILESFSHEFIGYLSEKKTYTPFLDSLFQQSLVFENGLANCKKSIEGIPAVLAGIPALTSDTYISSHYGGNRLEALPFILRKNGYTTAFFHGGRNGTMGFDEFSKIAGIDHYYGLDEYKGPSAFDGEWGIFDYEYLQYTTQQMSTLQQPFMAAIFTLSSHHPYTLPKAFENIIPNEKEPIQRTIRYADMALSNFFAKAKKQSWYENTLFIITADHTAKTIDPDYNTVFGLYRIPIAFFKPGSTLIGKKEEIAQQTDIMPSVLQYLGIENPFLAYGTSVFDNSREAYSISYINGIYYYFRNDYLYCFDGDSAIHLYNFKKDKTLSNDLKNSMPDTVNFLDKKTKATIQDYMERLTKNKMYYSNKY